MKIPSSTYKDIFEVLSDAIILIDENEQILSVNQRALTLLDTSEKDILGKSIDLFVPPDFRDTYGEILQRFVDAKERKVERHDLPLIELRRGDGTVFPARVTLSKAPTKDSWIVAVVLQDLTKQESDRKEILETNEKLQALDSIRQEFIGMAAHDLRAPLHKLSLSAELLTDESLPAEKKGQFRDIMARTIKGMQSLVNDLLSITSIESGKINLKSEQVSLIPYFQETYELHKQTYSNKNIRLNLQLDLKRASGYFDPNRISQVLNNLLGNALKFSNRDTEVTYQVLEEKNNLIIRVTDQGPGISKDEQQILFQPFSQTSNKPTAGEQSTGLGLAICKRIADLHKGTITVHSELGKGSTFTLTLPDALCD